MSTASEGLREVLAILDHGKRWTKGVLGRTIYGEECSEDDPECHSRCLNGAILYVAYNQSMPFPGVYFNMCLDAVKRTLKARNYHHLVNEFNDASDWTEVEQLLQQSIAASIKIEEERRERNEHDHSSGEPREV